jgi:hypothetical protein
LFFFISHILSGVVFLPEIFAKSPWSIGIIVDGFKEEEKEKPALDLFKYLGIVYIFFLP